MFIDPVLAAFIIIGFVVILIIVALPYITPMFRPVTENLHEAAGEKSIVKALIILGSLAFIAVVIGFVLFITQPRATTVAPQDTLPTTYPSATP
jgi:small neutral amino acid transporter SnatA (MarC family)